MFDGAGGMRRIALRIPTVASINIDYLLLLTLKLDI